MELILVVVTLVVATALPWFLESHLALRKRVADLERAVGIGKPDAIADLMDESK